MHDHWELGLHRSDSKGMRYCFVASGNCDTDLPAMYQRCYQVSISVIRHSSSIRLQRMLIHRGALVRSEMS